MRIQILLVLGFLSSYAMAQNAKLEKLTKDKVYEIMLLVENGDVQQALVESKKYATGPYRFGLRIRETGLHDDAIEWYVAMVDLSEGITEKADFYYGKAWIHFKMGRYKTAMEDADALLTVGPSEITRARTLFMMGRIFLQWSKFSKAHDSFSESKDVYGKLEKTGGLYLCYAGLAEIEICLDNYEQARSFS